MVLNYAPVVFLMTGNAVKNDLAVGRGSYSRESHQLLNNLGEQQVSVVENNEGLKG